MLALTVELLESDVAAAEVVRTQKTWISVDEYQDTNPLGERLLELWLGELVHESKRPYGPTAQAERGASSMPGRGTVTRGPNSGRRGRA